MFALLKETTLTQGTERAASSLVLKRTPDWDRIVYLCIFLPLGGLCWGLMVDCECYQEGSGGAEGVPDH